MCVTTSKYDKSLNDLEQTSLPNEAGLPKWGLLYRIAGVATVAMLILIPVQIAIFTIWPTPKNAMEWFQLFQSSWILGLMHLDFLYIINNSIVAVMYLAFYLSLRRKNEALMLIALMTGLLGTAAYYSSNPAFEMLSLSRLFTSNVAEPQRSALLAAGQVLIAQWKGTAFDVYYILSAICLILIAAVMFKSAVYGKAMAAIGLSSGILMLIPSTAGTLGLFFSLASLVPWMVFSAMGAVRFLRLGSMAPGNEPHELKEALPLR